MKKLLITIMAVVLMVGVADAEWKVEEAPKQLPGTKAQYDPEASREMRSLQWRCIGPYIGVRGTTVTMHPTDKNLFYHGHSSGGLWMTEDAGQYWIPISDEHFNVGSIGAMAVSCTTPASSR